MEMKRILLKLSGEALAGDKKTGFDEPTVTKGDQHRRLRQSRTARRRDQSLRTHQTRQEASEADPR